MTPLETIKTFLGNATDISLGYNEINFFRPDNLDNEQIGYSVDENGNSILTGDEGGWIKSWLVIACDEVGDPIIVDTQSNELAVLSAVHGDDLWESYTIADSLENFSIILTQLAKLSKERSTPAELEQNPVPDEDQKRLLLEIRGKNPNSEIWFWDNFFEDD